MSFSLILLQYEFFNLSLLNYPIGIILNVASNAMNIYFLYFYILSDIVGIHFLLYLIPHNNIVYQTNPSERSRPIIWITSSFIEHIIELDKNDI